MNQSFDIVKLKFTGPLHLSQGKPDGYDAGGRVLHSDALKSALMAAAIELRPEIGASPDEHSFLDQFDVSSAFPYWKEEYFFPKPLVNLQWKIKNKKERDSDKILKEVTFLGKTYFEKVLKAGIDKEILGEHLSDDKALISQIFQTELIFQSVEERFIFKSVLDQRVTVPRWQEEDTDGNTYYVERLFFREGAGLFFLIKFHENADVPFWKEVLSHIGEQGVGTDRATGNGQFTPTYLPKGLNLQIPDRTNSQMALSLFCPEKEEATASLFEGASYTLTKRGGWLTNEDEFLTFRKKSVYMFAEGSVFPKKALKGKVVNLKPDLVLGLDHPVWRDGRAWFLPIQTH
jgi:CRISPR-associated protein Csm4